MSLAAPSSDTQVQFAASPRLPAFHAAGPSHTIPQPFNLLFPCANQPHCQPLTITSGAVLDFSALAPAPIRHGVTCTTSAAQQLVHTIWPSFASSIPTACQKQHWVLVKVWQSNRKRM